jgi:hypothetical protein
MTIAFLPDPDDVKRDSGFCDCSKESRSPAVPMMIKPKRYVTLTLAEADVVLRVLKRLFEMNQVDRHLQ